MLHLLELQYSCMQCLQQLFIAIVPIQNSLLQASNICQCKVSGNAYSGSNVNWVSITLLHLITMAQVRVKQFRRGAEAKLLCIGRLWIV